MTQRAVHVGPTAEHWSQARAIVDHPSFRAPHGGWKKPKGQWDAEIAYGLAERERAGRLALALELRAARDRGELDQALKLLWEQLE